MTDDEVSNLVGIQPIRQLVKVVHGSHLYGTNTPASDMDFKGVHLPSGNAIILQRPEEVRELGFVSKDGTKNTADAVDYQSYSLQKFLKMLAVGDTVATEILFAPPEMMVEVDPLWMEIRADAVNLLNRQARGFVGYCQRQAAKYGIKGSRMAAVKKLVDLLQRAENNRGVGGDATLGRIEDLLRVFADGEEHASMENIPSPNGSDLWHIVCCDRKMPMTAAIKEATKVYTKVWENYGERARAAMTNNGIDWKAVSHAVRVARQALELLRTKTITFPRPDAAELLEIKLGKRPYSEVSPMLEALVAEVLACESDLPEETDRTHLDALVFVAYREQLEPVWRY